MAYDRTNTGPWTWVKTVGSVDDPLSQDWLGEREGLLEEVCRFQSTHARSGEAICSFTMQPPAEGSQQ